MLIAIEYMIQMIEGKWDFMAVELHDDIIVGKGKNIRFIQVKSSNKPHKFVVDVPLYDRSVITVGDCKAKENDSWIDKLFRKQKYFPSAEGYNCEFELATSYELICKSPETDISFYYEEFPKDIPKEIPESDTLLSKFDQNFF